MFDLTHYYIRRITIRCHTFMAFKAFKTVVIDVILYVVTAFYDFFFSVRDRQSIRERGVRGEDLRRHHQSLQPQQDLAGRALRGEGRLLASRQM